MSSVRRALGITVATLALTIAPAHAARVATDDTPPRRAVVVVTAGDTLAELAAGWPGGWTRAAHVNELDNPDHLDVGQVLIVPLRDGPRWTPPRPTPGASRSWANQQSTPATSPSSSSPSAGSPPSSAHSSVWHQLAACESGGNWSINTGNGYYGGLQFSLSSWRAVGGAGYPHEASAGEQIVRGQRLQAIQGWGAWPGCAAKLGLPR